MLYIWSAWSEVFVVFCNCYCITSSQQLGQMTPQVIWFTAWIDFMSSELCGVDHPSRKRSVRAGLNRALFPCRRLRFGYVDETMTGHDEWSWRWETWPTYGGTTHCTWIHQPISINKRKPSPTLLSSSPVLWILLALSYIAILVTIFLSHPPTKKTRAPYARKRESVLVGGWKKFHPENLVCIKY